jgi:predicted O-methyltransferase YrrM
LAKKARTIFEFGTCTGKTTYLLATNAPTDAIVHTITLSPDDINQYRRDGADDAHATRTAIAASRFSSYYYENTPVAGKVRQHFGDSKAFDHSSLRGKCDLIFVDGSHAYSYVVADSQKSLDMLAPGGVCVWHDYRGPHRPKGVYKALNELSKKIELRHVAGTSLVVYRKPI